MTLLWVLSTHDGVDLVEDLAADVAFEAAADFSVGFAGGTSGGEVFAGCGVVAHSGSGDDVEGAVELAVACSIESVASGVAG